MKIIVDTDVLIEFFRVENKSKTVLNKVFYQSKKHIPATTSITVAELWAGKSMNNPNNTYIVSELLSSIEIYYPNFDIATTTGEIIRETNYSVSFTDAHIAAFAHFYKLPLLTLNKKHFQKIPGIRLM